MEELISFNEAYFGKPQSLLDLEDYIEKLRAKYPYTANYLCSHTEDRKMMLNDEIIKTKIPNCIIKTFGYNDVVVGVSVTHKINAFTIVYPTKENKSKKDPTVLVTNKGFSFDRNGEKVNMALLLTLGLLFPREDDMVFTPAQIVSVILHEIGHSFSVFMIDKDKITDRSDEKFADQFVSMYGYSKEVLTVFARNGDITKKLKSNWVDKTFKDVPILNIIVTIGRIINSAAHSVISMDCHPNIKERLEIQIKQMESDLAHDKSLNAKSKKELADNIKACKDYVDQVFDTKNDSIPNKIIKFYYNKVEGYLPSNYFSNASSAKLVDPTMMNKKITEMKKNSGYFVKY